MRPISGLNFYLSLPPNIKVLYWRPLLWRIRPSERQRPASSQWRFKSPATQPFMVTIFMRSGSAADKLCCVMLPRSHSTSRILGHSSTSSRSSRWWCWLVLSWFIQSKTCESWKILIIWTSNCFPLMWYRTIISYLFLFKFRCIHTGFLFSIQWTNQFSTD